jgi:hypothetical protein
VGNDPVIVADKPEDDVEYDAGKLEMILVVSNLVDWSRFMSTS